LEMLGIRVVREPRDPIAGMACHDDLALGVSVATTPDQQVHCDSSELMLPACSAYRGRVMIGRNMRIMGCRPEGSKKAIKQAQ
jgi:hypothetical protein